jgi:hypothetical protein
VGIEWALTGHLIRRWRRYQLVSDKLLTAWCWLPNPGTVWRCHEMMSGLTVDAASKEETVEHFTRLWNSRSRLEWRYEAPPQPRRDSPKTVNAPAIEGDTDAIKFHRLILRAFHRDLHGEKKRWSADEIIAAINQAWEQARANG